MNNQKQKPPWEEDSDVPDAPLRRPNCASTNNLSCVINSVQSSNPTNSRQTSGVQQHVRIETKSTLSAEAKEWFPAGYRHSAQDRLRRVKQNQPSQQCYTESNGVSLDETPEHFGVYVQVQGYINILIEDPGQFDYMLQEFLEVLAPYFSESGILYDIAKLIFTEALEEPNFRYSAARLCRILEEQSPPFRSALHLFAGKLVEEITTEQERDLAMTLAELFAQSNCDNLYGNFVLESIEKIVSVGTLENVKCVCQVLKLTGAALDIHHRPKMNLIFNKLENVKSSLPTLINLIDYVTSLRESNWGQVDPNNHSVASNDRHSSHLDGPIFYGPDGKELSEEEKLFLSENCIEFFNEELLDSDPDELFDPDNEMDEEVHAAFREFTKANRE